jgi:O-antigen/teichoic acid export membrane protein
VKADQRATLKNAGWLAAGRVVQFGAGFVFLLFVPRALGPEVYGQFALVSAFSYWFSMMSGMGAVSLMSRFVPEMLVRGEVEQIRRLATGMLALRCVSAAASALIFFVLASFWLADLSRWAILWMAVAVAARIAGHMPFPLFLGLNQAARWASGELMRQLALAPFVFLGNWWAGLSGACFMAMLMDVGIGMVAMWWARDYLRAVYFQLDRAFLAPYLRYSSGFFAGNLIVMLFQQGGPPGVKLLNGDYVEAGHFALAFSVYMAGAQAIWKLLNAFGPMLTTMRTRGEDAAVPVWLERIVRLTTIGGVLAAVGMWAGSDAIVRVALGGKFAAVAPLLVLAVAPALWMGLGSMARLAAVVYDRPGSSVAAAAAQLAAFWVVGWWLIPGRGAWGASVATVVATAVFAAMGAWRMRAEMAAALRSYAGVLLAAALVSPCLWLLDWGVAARCGLFVGVFVAVLAGVGLLRREDLFSQ